MINKWAHSTRTTFLVDAQAKAYDTDGAERIDATVSNLPDATKILTFAASPSQYSVNHDLLTTQEAIRHAFNMSYKRHELPASDIAVDAGHAVGSSFLAWSQGYEAIEATMAKQDHQTEFANHELQRWLTENGSWTFTQQTYVCFVRRSGDSKQTNTHMSIYTTKTTHLLYFQREFQPEEVSALFTLAETVENTRKLATSAVVRPRT